METRIRRILNDDKNYKEIEEKIDKNQEKTPKNDEISDFLKGNGKFLDKNDEGCPHEKCKEIKDEEKFSQALKDDGIVISPSPISGAYTPITNAVCDTRIVRILKQLYSGIVSEFTDTSKYSYQHLITKATNSALSKALEEIATTEMRHMELLGGAIIDFGGRPRYSSGNGNFWNARYVNYNTDINSFLRQNIRDEERAIANYQRAINLVTNESLKKLFEEIIEDEREHITILNSFLN